MCVACAIGINKAASTCPATTYPIGPVGQTVNLYGELPLSAATVSAAVRSTDSYANGLLSGYKWSTLDLTFGMPTSASAYEYGGESQSGFAAANAAQATAIGKALDMVASVTALTFTAASSAGSADLRFANSSAPPTAWAYLPSASPQGGDVWFNSSNSQYANPVVGTYGFHTVVHEIGHALGLKHSHEKSGSFAAAPTNHQSMEYSVMSYSSYVGASVTRGYTNAWDSFAQTLMMDDIAALQSMYGANYGFNAGDTIYSWNPNTGETSINGSGQGAPASNRIFMTVWDGGGNDTYDLSAYFSNVVLDLNPGAWSITERSQLASLTANGSKLAIGNIANAKLYNKNTQSLIENATGGSGNDKITGNVLDNRLDGGAGNDSLTGGSGNDLFLGGAGADTYSGGAGIDTLDYSGSLIAIIFSAIRGGTAGDAAGDRALSIETLLCSAFDDQFYGGSGAEQLFGEAGNDILWGGAGNDLIDGGEGADRIRGEAGYDRMTGGNGFDVFEFLKASDIGKARNKRDVITDFVSGEDLVDISLMDANTTIRDIQDFVLLQTANERFTAAGQLRIRYESDATGQRTIIEGNIDRTLVADFQIELTGTHVLTAADYIL